MPAIMLAPSRSVAEGLGVQAIIGMRLFPSPVPQVPSQPSPASQVFEGSQDDSGRAIGAAEKTWDETSAKKNSIH